MDGRFRCLGLGNKFSPLRFTYSEVRRTTKTVIREDFAKVDTVFSGENLTDEVLLVEQGSIEAFCRAGQGRLSLDDHSRDEHRAAEEGGYRIRPGWKKSVRIKIAKYLVRRQRVFDE